MANYKCRTTGTETGEKSIFESQEKDQNVAPAPHESHPRDGLVLADGLQVSPQGPCSEVASAPHESHHRDWLVLTDGLQVSPQGPPCSEIERSEEAS